MHDTREDISCSSLRMFATTKKFVAMQFNSITNLFQTDQLLTNKLIIEYFRILYYRTFDGDVKRTFTGNSFLADSELRPKFRLLGIEETASAAIVHVILPKSWQLLSANHSRDRIGFWGGWHEDPILAVDSDIIDQTASAWTWMISTLPKYFPKLKIYLKLTEQ